MCQTVPAIAMAASNSAGYTRICKATGYAGGSLLCIPHTTKRPKHLIVVQAEGRKNAANRQDFPA